MSVMSLPTAPAFDQWWNLQGEWVEPPNMRRGGESGVQHIRLFHHGDLYSKRQVDHRYRSLRHPLGEPTVLRELRALQALDRLGVRVPRVVYSGARKWHGHWQALLVTEALNGFMSLDDWYASGQPSALGPAIHERLLKTLARTLANMHRGRWQHGCLYPKHIFVRAQGDTVDIALLDLEKSRQRLTTQAASRHDMRQLHRHRHHMPDSDWESLCSAYTACINDIH